MRYFLVATILLSLGRPALASEFERTIPAAKVRQVLVGVADADVRVIGWAEKNIKVEADVDPQVQVSDDRVSIGTFSSGGQPLSPQDLARERHVHWGRHMISEITVHMPADADLTIRSFSGELTVSKLAGRARLSVINGDVEIEASSGAVDVDVVSGDIDIRGLAGDLSAQSVSGEVMVRGCKALLLEAKSVSGDVEVRDSEVRTVRIASHSGSVLYAGRALVDGSVDLRTFSGDVSVELPPKAGFVLDATAYSGEIRLLRGAEVSERSGHRIHARTREKGAHLRLKTHSGDIRVK